MSRRSSPWFLAAALAIVVGPVLAAPKPKTSSVEFLDLAAARKAIVDESTEPYFKLLQPAEMQAKTGSPLPAVDVEKQREICRERYRKAVGEFTTKEKETLTWYVRKLDPLVTQYPLYAQTKWSFLKLSSDFEGGWPHTRGSHIVLSGETLQEMEFGRKSLPEWQALQFFGDVLLHEKLHVVQREHPEEFAKLYEGLWGFVHAKKVENCGWLTKHQLANPDGVDTTWVFPLKENGSVRWILPLVVLEGGDTNRLTVLGMHQVAVEVEPAGKGIFRTRADEDGKPRMQPLLQVDGYVGEFYSSGNIYHPNEAAADLFAKLVLLDDVAPGHVDAAELALRRKQTAPLSKWFKKILAE